MTEDEALKLALDVLEQLSKMDGEYETEYEGDIQCNCISCDYSRPNLTQSGTQN